MQKKLWQTSQQLHPVVEKYTSGTDVLLDQHLLLHDIYGSLAHTKMLFECKIIDKKSFEELKSGLTTLLSKAKKGEIILSLGDEDVHTRIENELKLICPESAGMLHTARSRNDQVLVDLRLLTKTKLLEVQSVLAEAIEIFLQMASNHAHTPLPGMTHMQMAMPSTVGLWLGALAESLSDDYALLESALSQNDQNPLGSGAAYGVTLPINREITTTSLGFAKTQNNALYCQNSRGKLESIVIFALSQVMATLNKFASDSLLFTTEPFGFVSFDKNLSTGSSIMPQKCNWDALEIMRSKYFEILSLQIQTQMTLASLPSGYNRDLQITKGALISSFDITIGSLEVARLFVKSLQIHQENIKKHLPIELFCAHWAYKLTTEKNWDFRRAYQYVKDNQDKIPNFDYDEVISMAISQGAPGNLGLERARKYLQTIKSNLTLKKQVFEKSLDSLTSKI